MNVSAAAARVGCSVTELMGVARLMGWSADDVCQYTSAMTFDEWYDIVDGLEDELETQHRLSRASTPVSYGTAN